MRAAVAGGTGLVGAALLRALADDPAFSSVASCARRRHDAPPRVEVRAMEDVPPCDVAFCALGTTIKKAGSQDAFRAVDQGLVVRFARRAQEQGARQIHVVSAMGADPASRVFYNRVKGDMEREVAALGIPATCFYRPSFLMGERAEHRAGERFGIALARALAPVIPRRFEAIPAHEVARAMVQHAKSAPSGVHVHPSDEIWRLSH